MVVVGVFKSCTGKGLVTAVLHSWLLKDAMSKGEGKGVAQLIIESREELQRQEAAFFEACVSEGWKVDDESVALESKGAVRLKVGGE
jgi:hypothetical protein